MPEDTISSVKYDHYLSNPHLSNGFMFSLTSSPMGVDTTRYAYTQYATSKLMRNKDVLISNSSPATAKGFPAKAGLAKITSPQIKGTSNTKVAKVRRIPATTMPPIGGLWATGVGP
jgi:hypothetical protein